jgi:hypothetical protein
VEIDVTRYSNVEDYLPYQVPEVWLFKQQQLLIYQFQETAYQQVKQSRYFPTIQLQSTIARCLQIAYDRNTSAAIRDLRQALWRKHEQVETKDYLLFKQHSIAVAT